MRSIDYHEIKSRYYDKWDEVALLLKKEIEAFIHLAPDCLVICNNTLHKPFDQIKSDLRLSIPVFHIVDAVGSFAQMQNLKHLLLLGTKFTMSDGFYQRRLEEQFGLVVQRYTIPIVQGILGPEFRTNFVKLIRNYSAVDTVVLACTELPLAIHQSDVDVVILNSIEHQCKEAFEFAISN